MHPDLATCNYAGGGSATILEVELFFTKSP